MNPFMNPLLHASRPWPKAVRYVVETLQAQGFEAYLVGGCVRDFLLNRRTSDYDIATNALPDTVLSMFPCTVGTGLKHGTVTVVAEGRGIEVTTYRIDSGYSDGRHPDAVTFTPSLVEDLARRDFTINAMAMGLDQTLVDPHGGMSDLRDRCIKAVGDPARRFGEDGLRILRALRIAAQLQFAIEPATLEAMEAKKNLLRSLSRERIGQELFKLAQYHWWLISDKLGHGPWLSELPDPLPKLRTGFAHVSKWEETTDVFRAVLSEPVSTTQDRAAITATVWLYLSHLEVEDAKRMVSVLTWPNALGRRISSSLQSMKQDPLGWSSGQWRQALFTTDLWPLRAACGLLDWLEDENGSTSQRSRRRQLFEEYVRQQPIFRTQDLKLSGKDLLEFGFRGPDIGRCLNRLVGEVLSGEISNERRVLVSRALQYVQEGPSKS